MAVRLHSNVMSQFVTLRLRYNFKNVAVSHYKVPQVQSSISNNPSELKVVWQDESHLRSLPPDLLLLLHGGT